MWRARSDGGSLLQLVDQVSLYALKDYLHDTLAVNKVPSSGKVVIGQIHAYESQKPLFK